MKRCLLFFAILFLSVASIYSQGKPEIKFGADDPFDLREVGALIIKDKDKFKVQFVAPENRRLTSYQNVDLKKDDIKILPPKRNAKITNAGWMKDKVFLHGYGVLIGKINEKPMIEKIKGDNEIVKNAGLKGGDVVTSINGQAIKTFIQFKETYDNIKPKQDVTIRFGNKSISFKKSGYPKNWNELPGAEFN